MRVFDESYGFSSYNPYQIIQDKQDFLWILYSDRIQRFNGKQVKDFFPGDRLSRVLCDRQNRIWVAGVYNVYLFSNDHEGFKKLAFDSTGDILIGHIFQLPGKPVWLHTSKGFYELDNASLNFNKITWPELQAEFPLDIRHFSVFENTLFFSNSDSIFAFDVVNRSRRSLKGTNTYGYHGLNGHLLLLSTWKNTSWWYDFANNKITPVSLNDEPGKENNFFLITGLEKINEKEWMLVSKQGLYRFNISSGLFRKLKLYHKGKPLEIGGSINGLYFDRRQNIWMISENGLISFKPNQETIGLLRNFETEPGKAWNNNVRNFMADEKENLWFVTEDGFAYWDLRRNSFTVYASKQGALDQLNHPSIRGLYYDGKYLILGPTNGGIWLFDPAKKKYKKPLYETGPKGDTTRIRLENDFIKNINRLHNGNYIIAARDGIYIMEGKTYTISRFTLPGKIENNNFSYQDSRKRIWIGTNQALHCLDSQMIHQFRIQPGIRSFYSICELKPDEYLVGGNKGLVLLKFSNGNPIVKKVDPLFDNIIIAAVIKDKTGKIWLSTLNHYLYHYDPVKHKIDSFDHTDNLQGNEYNLNSFYLSPGGMLFLGGNNGINYFYPNKISWEEDSLQVSITKVSVNLDDTSYYHRTGTISLKHFQNSIELTYISPNYSNAEQLQYRYRLQGIDTGWRSNGNNNSIRFTSLSPGKYVFLLAASINGSDWFESREKLSFTIAPPFWKRWWFLALGLITIAVLSVFLIRRRIRFIKNREAEKTELQKLKAAGYQAQLEIEQVINYFATSMNSVNSIDDILRDVAKNCISKLNFEDCVIYLTDEQRSVLVQKAAWGPKTTAQNKIINPIEIPFNKGIVGAVAVSGKAEIVNDTSTDERYIIDDIKRMSEITVPIVNNGKVMGVIDSEHSQKGFYTERHLQILATIASLCAGKIDIIRAGQQTREKEIELLKLHKDFATSQLTALRTQMNPHFIFNSLNSIQQYILQGNVVEANKYLSKFSKLQREILHCSNLHFISLEKEIEILNSYLQLEQHRFGESFTYAINMTDEIDPGEIKIPPMMLQPFVENAIWHGLMPRQGERNLNIHFDLYTDDILLATVQDNGIGRDASANLKQNNGGSTHRHDSKGMSIVHERLQLLQQQYDKPFEVAISDITDASGMVQGTQVVLKIYIGPK